jgi:hypothetical protein
MESNPTHQAKTNHLMSEPLQVTYVRCNSIWQHKLKKNIYIYIYLSRILSVKGILS